MRLLLLTLAGCGGLDIYDEPVRPVEAHDTDGRAVFVTPDEAEDLLPGTSLTDATDPVYRLRLREARIAAIPELEEVLALGDDLAIEIEIADPPMIEGVVGALLADGTQDWCVPTTTFDGELSDDDSNGFQLAFQGRDLPALPLPWGRVSVIGDLEGSSMSEVIVSLELPATAVPIADVCAQLGCQMCSGDIDNLACVIVTAEVPVERLSTSFEIEPLAPGDVAAAPMCDTGVDSER